MAKVRPPTLPPALQRGQSTNQFITLTTDFGLADGFVGTMKGVIYTINPDATITDISHEIGSQDVLEAAFLLESSCKYFPQGTVHVVVVDPGVGSQRRAIAVETEEYYFVAPDNGVLTWALAHQKFIKAVELTNRSYFLDQVSNTFHGRDIFAPVAAHLSLGTAIEALGPRIDDLMKIRFPEPQVSQSQITGHVIHIDKFGNLVTDIPRKLFESTPGSAGILPASSSDRRFSIAIAGVRLDRISQSYTDVPIGKPLAIFDSFGNLEIAVNGGNAAKILGIRKGDRIIIT